MIQIGIRVPANHAHISNAADLAVKGNVSQNATNVTVTFYDSGTTSPARLTGSIAPAQGGFEVDFTAQQMAALASGKQYDIVAVGTAGADSGSNTITVQT